MNLFKFANFKLRRERGAMIEVYNTFHGFCDADIAPVLHRNSYSATCGN